MSDSANGLAPPSRDSVEGAGRVAGGGGDLLLEQRLGAILRIGVRISTACLGAGLLLSFFAADSPFSVALMTAGVLILIATPVARVATSVLEYGFERDWTFFILTAIVLLELCGGIIAALVFHKRL